MSDAPRGRFCPYRGLTPFAEADRDYFFGRDRDIARVAANVATNPLTVLYGPSGVGKTSLLRAGVMPRVRTFGDVSVVIARDWHDYDAVRQLKRGIAAAATSPGAASLDPEAPLQALLADASRRTRTTFAVLLDQFEEYFLYHNATLIGDAFERELALAVNARSGDANFLFSMREDALSLLDRLVSRIPNLLQNMVRAGHLDARAALDAITLPIARYRERIARPEGPVEIEPELPALLIDALQKRDGRAGRAPAREQAEAIETPFLQMILERLWRTEADRSSSTMTVETFERIGRPECIVHVLVEESMNALSPSARSQCANFFDRIVTPSLTKIAFDESDVVHWTKGDPAELKAILAHLNERRLLRSVPPNPARPESARYEIFHDLLGPSLLRWSERFVERREHRQRLRRWFGGSAGLALLLVTALLYAYSLWLEQRPWATLANLSTGTVHTVQGNLFSIGRNTEALPWNDLELLPRSISRFHFRISRDGFRATDMRSMFGTTVNAQYIPYGVSRPLASGDIVALGGVAALRFESLEYGLPFMSPRIPRGSAVEGWGILVDGAARTVLPLKNRDFAIGLREGRLKVLAIDSPDGLLDVHADEKDSSIRDRPGGPSVEARWKYSDHDYRVGKLEAGVAYRSVPILDGSNESDAPAVFYACYQLGDVSFQIVLNLPKAELEP